MKTTQSAIRASVLIAVVWASCSIGLAQHEQQAQSLLEMAGIKGGLVVHVGCGDGRLTAAFHTRDNLLVQGLDADVSKARATIRAAGVYGPVTAEPWRGNRLPYAENLVQLAIVSGDQSQLSDMELLRVLSPGGVALRLDAQPPVMLKKPWPKEIDQWTHYLYDASNNAVGHDVRVAPPRRMQWMSEPLWSRNHEKMSSFSTMVTAAGRVFMVADEQLPVSMSFPPDWRLTARDAFSGVKLWQLRMPEWWPAQFGFKAGPANLTRRLVAIGDRVYATLGIRAPISVLDAATGKTLATWEETRDAEEIVVVGDTAFVTGHDAKEYSEIRTFPKSTDLSLWNTGPRWLKAIDVGHGKVRWQHAGPMTPRSLAADGTKVYYHDGQRIIALNCTTGGELWKSDPAPLTKTPVSNFGPTLVVQSDVVLFSGGATDRPKGSAGANTLYAYSGKTGRTIWTAEHPDTGHECPKDLLVIGGKVWLAETAGPRSPGEFVGRDLQTGEIKVQFAPDVKAQWFHHRCYIAKATDRFVLTSRKGVEYVDLAEQHWTPNHWVRGACIFGILPANGMLYAPPQPCGCLPETKLTGLWALAPAGEEEPNQPVETAPRLEEGPAYKSAQSSSSAVSDWPTYRHDAQRSGGTTLAVAPQGKSLWTAKLGGKLSSVTAAEGKLFVARVEEHEVCALSANQGSVMWRFTAGGRVTAPPTIAAGRALFACADGWVYCLNSANGQLAWRFRVAPRERQVVARDQVESAWPVHGSVLVKGNVAYAVAGHSMFLDGGMRLVRLDIPTGKLISEEVLDDKDPNTGKPLQEFLAGMNMPVSVPDILSADDKHLYMMSQTFTLDGKRQRVAPYGSAGESGPKTPPPAEESHLFSAYLGLLDDSWHTRSYWIYGTWMSGGSGGWYQAGQQQPAGRIMVFDDDRLYGYGRQPDYFGWTTAIEYRLFATKKVPAVKPFEKKLDGYSPRKQFVVDWEKESPLHVRGLVKAGDVLFLAGSPDALDEGPKKQYGNVPESRRAFDAWQGREGGLLRAVAARDGTTLADYKLASPPTFDGLIAAAGRLYLSTLDGNIVCWGQ